MMSDVLGFIFTYRIDLPSGVIAKPGLNTIAGGLGEAFDWMGDPDTLTFEKPRIVRAAG